MSEVNLWKLVDKIEDIVENLQDVNDYLDQIEITHNAFNEWIQAATESLTQLQKQVNFLNSKRTAV